MKEKKTFAKFLTPRQGHLSVGDATERAVTLRMPILSQNQYGVWDVMHANGVPCCGNGNRATAVMWLMVGIRDMGLCPRWLEHDPKTGNWFIVEVEK